MCDSSPPAGTTLAGDRHAARSARRFLDEYWCVEHAALLRPQAEVVVSELVSNAVQHGSGPVAITLDCAGVDGVTLAVSDGSVDLPELRDGGPSAASGRGVRLVAVLSDDWGVRTRPGGKTVWSLLRP
ncbi:MAG: ATP-binding protein [Janthinobacterium lividum]